MVPDLLLRTSRKAVNSVLVPILKRRLSRFLATLDDPRSVQRQALWNKLRYCEGSQFARDHAFHEIRTLDAFRRNVPIVTYDSHEPYIRDVAEGRVNALFRPSEKIVMFTMSSGTTGAPKLIPITRPWMDEYRRGWNLWGVRTALDHRALLQSRYLTVVGDWDMKRSPSGHPCGMASGMTIRAQNLFVRLCYSVPSFVHAISDSDARYYTMLRLSVGENIGFFTTTTPSVLMHFANTGNAFRETLIRDVADGTLSDQLDIPHEIRCQLARRVRLRRPDLARKLEQIVARTGTLYPKDYWDLSVLGCWIGGTVGGTARNLSTYYGNVPRRDIGLVASEGRFTIPLEDETTSGVLDISSHFYEFIPEEEIDSVQPTVLEAHELEADRNYFIVITTFSGLFRYNLFDMVRCTGFRGRTPLLSFLNKGQRISDMEGEKITEHHLVEAVVSASEQLELPTPMFTAVPMRPSASAPHYVLLIEEQELSAQELATQFTQYVESWLASHNVMYQTKRADGYLDPCRISRVPIGTWDRYRKEELARRGVGEDQYKHPSLILDASVIGRFTNSV